MAAARKKSARKPAARKTAGKKKSSTRKSRTKAAARSTKKRATARPRVVPTGHFRLKAAACQSELEPDQAGQTGFPGDLSPPDSVAMGAEPDTNDADDWGELQDSDHDHTEAADSDAYAAHTDDIEDEDYDSEGEGGGFMSVGDHLEELRQRLFWMMGVVAAFGIGAGVFSSEIHDFLIEPYVALTGENLILQNIYGPMEILIKVSVLSGIGMGFPFLVFILWGFVTPAVSRKIAWLGRLAVACSALLFWTGISVCWFYVFPLSLEFFLVNMQMAGVESVLSVERFYSFLFALHLAAGIAFQLPIVLIALGALGILTVAWHARTWRVAIIVLFVSSAIITPPDPWSMLGVGGLLVLLYGFSVAIVWLIERARGRRDAR